MKDEKRFKELVDKIDKVDFLSEVKDEFLVLSKSQNQELGSYLIRETDSYINDIISECMYQTEKIDLFKNGTKEYDLTDEWHFALLRNLSKTLRDTYYRQYQLLLNKNIDINHIELIIYASENSTKSCYQFAKIYEQRKEYFTLMQNIYTKLHKASISLYDILDSEKLLVINDEFKSKIDACEITKTALLIQNEVIERLPIDKNVEDKIFINGMSKINKQHLLMNNFFAKSLEKLSVKDYILSTLINETEALNEVIRLVNRDSKFVPYIQLLEQKYKTHYRLYSNEIVKVKKLEK